MAYTDDNKREVLDQTPVAIPLGMKKPESLHETLKRLLYTERYNQEFLEGYETPEEADDFDCDDDFDPNSPWEECFDPRTGESIGFFDQNRYQKPQLYERRSDERDKSYSMDKNSNGSDRSVQGDSVGIDSQRSE